MGTTIEKVVALAKNRGFIYPGSEIYGGLSNSWDYGPLGAELKNNIKLAWYKKFIQENINNVLIDTSLIMNTRVWEASGHVGNFSDPLMDCKECKERFRADKLIEDFLESKGEHVTVDGWENEKMASFILENQILCPTCNSFNFTEIRQFNLMFKTHVGVTDDNKNTVYLRPETAQGIFINFKNVQRTTRKKLPFGIGQIGKSFRNEITPGNFIFRTREFEQLELEFFCKPEESMEWYKYWQEFCINWLKSLNIKEESLNIREHSTEELAHYSLATADIEFGFPFGIGELWGISNRGSYDLNKHQEHSGEDMSYFDPFTNEKYIPHCIEPSLGIDRVALAFFCDAYDEEELEGGDVRTVLRLHFELAPIKIAILPLSKKLSETALEIVNSLNKTFRVDFDETGAIGRRYRRQDEIGTPFCVTVDFDTKSDNKVTVRDRDTMVQERISISDLENYFTQKLKF